MSKPTSVVAEILARLDALKPEEMTPPEGQVPIKEIVGCASDAIKRLYTLVRWSMFQRMLLASQCEDYVGHLRAKYEMEEGFFERMTPIEQQSLTTFTSELDRLEYYSAALNTLYDLQVMQDFPILAGRIVVFTSEWQIGWTEPPLDRSTLPDLHALERPARLQ